MNRRGRWIDQVGLVQGIALRFLVNCLVYGCTIVFLYELNHLSY